MKKISIAFIVFASFMAFLSIVAMGFIIANL
jgi:hypothetical protein